MTYEWNWREQFVHDLDSGMARRINCIIKDRNLLVDGNGYKEIEFQYYGKRTSSLVQGMRAAVDEYDKAGSRGIEELKEKYSGDFADGVEIGAKATVSSESEFTFTHTYTSEGSESETNNTSSFTFTQ